MPKTDESNGTGLSDFPFARPSGMQRCCSCPAGRFSPAAASSQTRNPSLSGPPIEPDVRPERRRKRADPGAHALSVKRGMMATRAQSTEVSDTAGPEDGVRRRDFLNVAAVSFAGVGTVAAIAPLL